jgi:hypothetical protein
MVLVQAVVCAALRLRLRLQLVHQVNSVNHVRQELVHAIITELVIQEVFAYLLQALHVHQARNACRVLRDHHLATAMVHAHQEAYVRHPQLLVLPVICAQNVLLILLVRTMIHASEEALVLHAPRQSVHLVNHVPLVLRDLFVAMMESVAKEAPALHV